MAQVQTTLERTDTTVTEVRGLIRALSNIPHFQRCDLRSTSCHSLRGLERLQTDIIEPQRTLVTNNRMSHRELGGFEKPVDTFVRRLNISGNRRKLANNSSVDWESAFSAIRPRISLSHVICYSPIGTLYYRRTSDRFTLTREGLVTDDADDERHRISFLFLPAKWISRSMVEISFEVLMKKDLSRTFSFQMRPPARMCFDKEVLAALGLEYNERKRRVKRGWKQETSPLALRDYLIRGRVGPNDLVLDKDLGVVSLLEVSSYSCLWQKCLTKRRKIIIANSRMHPEMASKVCSVLLNHGARVDTTLSEFG